MIRRLIRPSSSMLTISDFEAYARKHLKKSAFEYYYSGADAEVTLMENRNAFERLCLRPRMMKDVSKRDLTVKILGEIMTMPIGIAPTAMQCMAHPDGEKATAVAAANMGVIMILSTLSTTSIEDVAASTPENAIRWFQLYIYKDREVTERMVRRAENSNFKAIVLTVDAPYFGRRLADIRNNFKLPSEFRLANFDENDIKSSGVHASKGSGINKYVASLFDQSLTWKDIYWLKEITKLPIILKGILTAEDAKEAAECGIAAIIVSNHGARQLDHEPATIEVLPEIVKAVGNSSLEIYMDGGVRNGSDVFKALALGARAVFVGRPAVWGLAYKGEKGVQKVLEILKEQLDLTMALSGCATIQDIGQDHVRHKSFYSSL